MLSLRAKKGKIKSETLKINANIKRHQQIIGSYVVKIGKITRDISNVKSKITNTAAAI